MNKKGCWEPSINWTVTVDTGEYRCITSMYNFSINNRFDKSLMLCLGTDWLCIKAVRFCEWSYISKRRLEINDKSKIISEIGS